MPDAGNMICVKAVQPLNIFDTLTSSLKCIEERSMDVMELQPMNMLQTPLKLQDSKLDKSIEERDAHPRNISSASTLSPNLTLVILIEAKDEHPLKLMPHGLPADKSSPVRSTDFSEVQFEKRTCERSASIEHISHTGGVREINA